MKNNDKQNKSSVCANQDFYKDENDDAQYSHESLDFYAKIEPLFGFYNAYDRLYDIYIKQIYLLFKFKNRVDAPKPNMLDFGCGNGRFGSLLTPKFNVLGCDKSPKMLEICKSIRTTNRSLQDIDAKFDLITAVSDVLNYLDKNELMSFFSDSFEKLNEGGYLIFDVNTKFGFDEVASGSLYLKDMQNDLVIDAKFDKNMLETDFIYFAKNGDLYKRSVFHITQYYHTSKDILELSKASNLKQIKRLNVNLFSDHLADKALYIFQKQFQ